MKGGRSHILPLAIFATAAMVLMLPLARFRHLPAEAVLSRETHLIRKAPLQRCGHILLVSAPRHGSTWFLDSVEGCPSAQTERANYKRLIASTELWTHHEGPVYDLSPFEAANYIMKNCSVKLFPTLERRGEERVKQLLKLVKRYQIPVFLLRRNPEGSYASLSHARETGMWAKNSGNSSAGHEFVWDDKFDEYRKLMDGYFEDVKTLMKAEDLTWDEFYYDQVQSTPEIAGVENNCFIQNCNFI